MPSRQARRGQQFHLGGPHLCLLQRSRRLQLIQAPTRRRLSDSLLHQYLGIDYVRISMKSISKGAKVAGYPFQSSKGSQTSTLMVSFHPGWVYELLLVSKELLLSDGQSRTRSHRNMKRSNWQESRQNLKVRFGCELRRLICLVSRPRAVSGAEWQRMYMRLVVCAKQQKPMARLPGPLLH